MAYQIITAKAAGDVLTASYINTYYKGNIEWLLNGKQIQQIRYAKSGSNYTISGTTTWADIDSTNLKLSITSNFITGRLEVVASFWGSVSFSGGSAPYNIYFDIYDNTSGIYLSSGTSTPATGGLKTWGLGAGSKVTFATTAIPTEVNLQGVFTGLAAGTHDLRLRWKVSNANTSGIVYADTEPTVYMRAVEF